MLNDENASSITLLMKAQAESLKHLENANEDANKTLTDMNGKLSVYFLGIKPEDHVKHHVFFAAAEDRFVRLEQQTTKLIEEHEKRQAAAIREQAEAVKIQSRDIEELKKFMWKAMGVISVFSAIPVLNLIYNLLKAMP